MTRRFSPFVLLCIMGGLAIFSSTMSKNPALPLFIRSLGVPVETVGFIAAASTVVGIAVSIPAGILSDIIGRRKVMLTAAVIFATAPFLYLLVSDPWHLVLVRIYHGLATAILGPVAMAAVADTFQKGRGEKMGWYSSATMVGRFAAPFVGGALIFGSDFRWVYLADGFMGILALIAALNVPLPAVTSATFGKAVKEKGKQAGRELVLIFRNRRILATSGVEAMQYFAFGAVEVFLPIYLNEQLHLTPVEIGLLFTVQILAAALTKPVMGRLSDKHGRVPLIGAGLVLGGLTTALLTISGSYFIIAALIALFGLGLATVTASTSALVADLASASGRGGAMGVLSSIMDVGQSTGPMLAGILIGALAYSWTFSIVGAAMIVTGILYALGMRGVETRKMTA